MARLLVHVEGQTEESFVNEILGPHLYGFGWGRVGARLLGNARQRTNRGGARAWAGVRKEIANHLSSDLKTVATTMVDYYALPQGDANGWPGRHEASTLPFPQKAHCVQQALIDDMKPLLGQSFYEQRFVPFVVMHEFEGLLFSDCQRFANAIGQPDLAVTFQGIRDQFESPEEINDSRETAPSKRILQIVPAYGKPLHGVLAALELGLDKIRAQCPQFNKWVQTLESIPSSYPHLSD